MQNVAMKIRNLITCFLFFAPMFLMAQVPDDIEKILERNFGIVQDMYGDIKDLKNFNRAQGLSEHHDTIGLYPMDLDSFPCSVMNAQLDSLIRIHLEKRGIELHQLEQNGDSLFYWSRLNQDGSYSKTGSKILNLTMLYIPKRNSSIVRNKQENELIEEYNQAIKTFGRRCSRFIERSYVKCIGEDYVNEGDLNRIDMSISSLEVRKNEIQQYFNFQYMLSLVDAMADTTLHIADTVVRSSQDLLLMEMRTGFERIKPKPFGFGTQLSFHVGMPSHFGASATFHVPQNDLMKGDYQVSLTAMGLFHVDSTSVKFGGQAGIISQKFGARAGILLNPNKNEDSYGMILSILFREKHFVYGIDASKYYYGISMGYGFGSAK